MINERKSYNQVLEVLKYMDKKYIEKIPNELILHFQNKKSTEYNFSINPEIALKGQNLSKETLNILAMLNLNYWCTDNEHKKELIKKYYNNQIKYEKELKQKYNVDDIFKKNSIKNDSKNEIIKTNLLENSNNLPQLSEKNKWYKSIINFIKRLFKKQSR